MKVSRHAAAVAALLPFVLAAPNPHPTSHPAPATTAAPDPHLLNGILNTIDAQPGVDGIEKALAKINAGLKEDFTDVTQVASAFAAVITKATQSNPAPTNIQQAASSVSSIFRSSPTNPIIPAARLVLNGITPNKYNKAIIDQVSGKTNSFDNGCTRRPKTPVFPKLGKNDAPFSLSEAALRKAIYFPPEFTYGEKDPVLMVPGTGSTGGDTFSGNMIPLLTGQSYADPVWLNVPNFMLDDAQLNSEYIAYAINYISGISKNRRVGVITWSQGGLDTQWALKYWPSARKVVKSFIAISPDYHGTVEAHILCPGFPVLPCNPSVLQQATGSSFISSLLADGGDSAYVPTTNIYSSFFDEVVEPQTGNGASAFLKDARRVGVSNNEVQAICPGGAAGSFYTHEGVLFNPIAFHLAKDALIHSSAGQIKRLDLDSICKQFATDGLSVNDVLDTEATFPQALLNILLNFPRSLAEPAVKAYAKQKA